MEPVGAAGRPLRGRLTAFVARHHVAWEGTMGLLALCYLAVAFLTDENRTPSYALLIILASIFIVEFVARWLDAPSRGRYFRQHWIDFISCIPLIGGLRSLRLLRLLRVGSVARIVSLGTREVDEHGVQRQSWWFLGPLLALVWVVSAVVYYSLEHHSNPNVNSIGDALYWSFVTTTTVGYGDVPPVTSEGRVLAGLLVFGGIGLVGVASAQVTSRLLSPDDRGQDARLDRMEEQLQEIAATLADPHRRSER